MSKRPSNQLKKLKRVVKKMPIPKVWSDEHHAYVEVGPTQAYNMNFKKVFKDPSTLDRLLKGKK
jgi:hypothetical protein